MAEVVTKRHPIRAALWGILIGVGLIIWFTFAQPVIGIDSASSVLIKWGVLLLGSMAVAVVLALMLPAKKPKGSPPAAPAPAAASAAGPAAEPVPAGDESVASDADPAAGSPDPDDGSTDATG